METAIILAVSENNIIGNDKKLPWHISEDLKWFKSHTFGYPVIMGRLCYESVGKPLPGRTNIILTRNTDYKAEGCIIVYSPEEALKKAKKYSKKKVFIAGGGEIYKIFLKYSNRIYLTKIHHKFEGDVFFYMPKTGWREIWREDHLNDKPYSYSFLIFEKK